MDGVTFESKEAYEKTMEARLSRLGTQIDELQRDVEKMGADAKVEFYKWIEETREKQARAMNKFREMRESSGEIWSDIKAGTEKAAQDLKETLEIISPKIRNFPRFRVAPSVKWIGLAAGGILAGYLLGRYLRKSSRSV